MSEIDIFRDFKDYACDECVENYDECDNDDCWAKIMYKQLKRLQAENERLKDAIKSINKPVFLPNIEQEVTNKYRKVLKEIREIANLIVNDEDKPSCVNDDNCPLNDGDGLDNHCDLNCPYILGKHIKDKISEVLDERN